MSSSEVLFGLIIVLICGASLGLAFGIEHGRKTACESVKLEWVQDKCMKVTREAV